MDKNPAVVASATRLNGEILTNLPAGRRSAPSADKCKNCRARERVTDGERREREVNMDLLIFQMDFGCAVSFHAGARLPRLEIYLYRPYYIFAPCVLYHAGVARPRAIAQTARAQTLLSTRHPVTHMVIRVLSTKLSALAGTIDSAAQSSSPTDGPRASACVARILLSPTRSY